MITYAQKGQMVCDFLPTNGSLRERAMEKRDARTFAISLASPSDFPQSGTPNIRKHETTEKPHSDTSGNLSKVFTEYSGLSSGRKIINSQVTAEYLPSDSIGEQIWIL